MDGACELKWFVGCPFSILAKMNRLGVGWSLKFGRGLPPGDVNRAGIRRIQRGDDSSQVQGLLFDKFNLVVPSAEDL